MAPASASLLPAASSNAGTKRPFAAEASHATELPLALPQVQESAARKKNGQSEQQKLECPRCSSTDTKFCYYNNYSTTQPRHYCRTCRRYWTQGGTLRNVPVGGACRRGGSSKRRRPSAEPQTTSSDSPQPGLQETRLLSEHPLPLFPFLTDGGPVFLPQFDLGLGGFPWTPATTDHLYDGLAAPWGGCEPATGRSPSLACGTTSAASSSPGHHRHRPGTDQRHHVSQRFAGAFEAPVLSSRPRSRHSASLHGKL